MTLLLIHVCSESVREWIRILPYYYSEYSIPSQALCDHHAGTVALSHLFQESSDFFLYLQLTSQIICGERNLNIKVPSAPLHDQNWGGTLASINMELIEAQTIISKQSNNQPAAIERKDPSTSS